MQSYPHTRLRRLRQASWSRRLVAESDLSVSDLVWPLFVAERAEDCCWVASLPGVRRHSVGELVLAARQAWETGIPAIAIFPCIAGDKKDERGTEALNADNLVCQSIRAIKDAVPDIGVICDIALDPYTSHGQDGLVESGKILNDETVAILSQQAVLYAATGCDIVAPSDMMDGRVGAVRATLEAAGYTDTLILSYAAKYASAFYGPFREAVGSKRQLGAADKKTYQMDPANAREARQEIALDIAEGADMVMVKPGMPYLDIIRDLTNRFDIPVFAYQVSGEYAMIKHAAAAGAFDEEEAMLESLQAFKRAGACGIFTYAALEMALLLQ